MGSGKDKSSWGGYDAVKGHGVEETGTPELGRESEDDLILFKLQLAEQYKERDLYSAKVSRSASLCQIACSLLSIVNMVLNVHRNRKAY